jgi:anti-anti-sigma factor
MDVGIERQSGRIVVRCSGRMTFRDNESFLLILSEFPGLNGGAAEFVLSGLEYVDSFAVGLLLQARDHALENKVRLTLVEPSATVRSILEQLDLASELPVVPPLKSRSEHHNAVVTGVGGLTLAPFADGTGMALTGRFTFADQGAFVSVLKRMEHLDGKTYRIDLSQVSFMDSGGLSMLMMANDQARLSGGTLVLVKPAERVRQLLLLAAADTVMPIEG